MFRGKFLIHASKNIDKDRLESLGIDYKIFTLGAIRGTAVLYDVKQYKSKKELGDKSRHYADIMYSKGLNQEEIARELRVDQPTISRDLQYIKHEATFFQCKKCKTEEAVIFQDNGEYCLATRPNASVCLVAYQD